MLQTQPLQIEDFSGGITDDYLDAAPNKYEEADNFIVTTNKKLYTRPGSTLFDASNPQISTGNVRVGYLETFNDWLIIHSDDKIHYIDGTFQVLQGPTGNEVFSAGDTTNYISIAKWNNHLYLTSDAFPRPMKIYEDGAGDLQVRNSSLPALATSPTCTPAAGANSYIYAFVHYYTYANQDLTFEDFGPLTTVEVINAIAPNSTAIAISAIPVLSNSGGDNYGTSSVKIKIYRTTNAGTTFFYVGEVTNGTTTYSDTMSDATLITRATLYTTDGSLENDEAPLSKYVHVTDNVAYYAHLKDGSNTYVNRVRMSKPSDPDACPGSFFVDVDDTITGMSSFQYTPIVFCKGSIYRLDGKFGADGSGLVTVQKISDTVGCVSNHSIVRTTKGTFFAGNDGFYVTNGYQVDKLSDEFNVRYKSMLAKGEKNIVGTFDEENERVMWAVKNQTSTDDNDTIFNLELAFGNCFTTWSGGDNLTNFTPTAITYHNKQIIRGDLRGYVFKHATSELTDPKVDTTISPSTWEEATIIYNYVSAGYDFGTKFMRKFVPRIGILASSQSALALQPISINDDGLKTSDLKPIVSYLTFLWGDPAITWGDASLIWNYSGIIEEWRRFPATNLRCTYKQIQLTNAYVVVVDSDDTVEATVDTSAGPSVTLDNIADFSWLNDVVDYYITFDSDNFTRDFLITDRVSDSVITIQDTSGALTNGSKAWKIRAKRKNQILNLLAYTIHFAILGKTQKAYQAGEGA